MVDYSSLKCFFDSGPIQKTSQNSQKFPDNNPPQQENQIALIVIGSCVIIAVVTLIGIGFNNRYVIMHIFLVRMQKKKLNGNAKPELAETVQVYASHADSFENYLPGGWNHFLAHWCTLIGHWLDKLVHITYNQK